MKSQSYSVYTRVLFFVGLLFSLVWFNPFSETIYELPKIALFRYWIQGMVGVVIVLGGLKMRTNRIRWFWLAMLAAYVGYLFAASVFGVNVSKSLVGNYFRQMGLITMTHLMGLVFVVMMIWKSAYRRWLSGVAVLAVGWSSLIAIAEMIFYLVWGDGPAAMWEGMPSGGFGQPNFLAGFLVVSLPLVKNAYETHSKVLFRRAIMLVAGLAIVAILMTQSWGALLVLLVYGLIEMALDGRWKMVAFVGVALCFVAGAYLSLQHESGFVAESRTRVYVRLLQAVPDRWLTGYGWSNIDYAFEAAPAWPFEIQNDIYVDKAHGHFLEHLVAGGVIGLFVYVAICLVVMRELWKKWRSSDGVEQLWWKSIGLVFVLFLLHSQTNVISISEEILWWIVVGVMGAES